MAKIMVVDDEALMLKLVSASLEEAGHETLCVQDPRDALTLVEAASLDGFVLDIVMPEMSGWDVLAKLRSHPKTKSLPIIILTSLAEPPYRVRALREGANDCLSKPFDPEELVARLEGLLAYRSEDVSELQGNLTINPLHNLLQFLAEAGKPGYLKIFSKEGAGSLFMFGDGSITAEYLNFVGMEAGEALLELTEGSFRFHLADAANHPQTLEPFDFNRMLFKAAWVADELSARESHLPDPEAPLAILTLTARFPSKFSFLPLAKMALRLRDEPGSSMNDLIAAKMASSERTRLAVALLVEYKVAR